MFKSEKEKLIMDIKNLEKQLNRRPTKHDSSTLYNKSRKYFGNWNKLMEKAGYKVKYYQYPKIPNKLNPDLAYFLGLIITDGHLQYNKKYGLYLFTSYEAEKRMILKLIKKLFNYDAGVYKRKKHGFNKRFNFQITINSKALVNCLNKKFNMPIGNKSLITRASKLIIKSSNKNISSFIRGVIDGDGHITQNRVHISSGSYLFLVDIIKLLSRLYIKCKSKVEKRKTCYVLNLNKHESSIIYNECYDKARYFYPRKKIKIDMLKNIN